MSPEPNAKAPSLLSSIPPATPVARKRGAGPVWVVVALLVAIPASLWGLGVRPTRLWSKTGPTIPTLVIDRGDVSLFVVESGSLESANNETVKCQVEALVGQVTGQQQGGMMGAGGRGGMAGAGGRAGAAGAAAAPAAAPPAAAAQGGGSRSVSAPKTTASTGAVGGLSGAAGAGGGGAGGGGGAAGGQGAGGAGTATVSLQRPNIRSFTFVVQPHMPTQRAVAAGAAANGKGGQANIQLQQQMQGRGGGGGGGGGGMMGQMEKPGSTRIISILPEGEVVKKGDVICELDSAPFKDEAAAQRIKVVQAEASYQQVQSLMISSKIAYDEYHDGILPQDRQLVDQYIESCVTDLNRSKLAFDWSKMALDKQLLSPAQHQANEFTLQRSEIMLREAKTMKNRLEQFTGPRLLKNLQAKIESIRADLLSQETALEIEKTRLRRLETNIVNCTVKAPRDGIVVYANQNNGWGRTEVQIIEGATVREGQPLINLPDPRRMKVKTKVNESKVALIQPGQRAEIRVDAFPTRVLTGKVTDVTPIGSQINGPLSDVRGYLANVEIDEGGFEGLKPGLSAEVTIDLARKHDVVRISTQAIRRVGRDSYAAVSTGDGFSWRKLSIGAIDPAYAEVLSGLEPGDRVAADASALPAPTAEKG